MKTALTLIAALLGVVLFACGGTGPEEAPKPHPGVDCQAKPEVCK